jgi:hypothetical protein
VDRVVRENEFTHAPPCVGGQCGTQDTFLPYSGPRVLLPTKTSRTFSQFPDNSLFIVFRCCGYIWWCLVVYSIVYMLLVVFFLTVRVRAVLRAAVAAVGLTCAVR